MYKPQFLVINSSFQEVDHLATELFEKGYLYKYIRPYTYLYRPWEKLFTGLPIIGKQFQNTFGRRRLPHGLTGDKIYNAEIVLDFLEAILIRLPIQSAWYTGILTSLARERSKKIGYAGSKFINSNVDAVIASWVTAKRVFQVAKEQGKRTILNYPFAHHRFAKKYLLDEMEREPDFASTMNAHNLPEWFEEQLNKEIELADRILVGSKFVRNSFVTERVPEKKISIVPYGADLSLFSTSKPKFKKEGKFSILFVGQIGQRKGISYLLRAYKKLHCSDTILTLVGRIVGDDKPFSKYEYLYRHIPNVPKFQLAKIYQEADVFIFPTLMEGMPIVVLEAMASGLPVIVTPNGPNEVVRDGVDGFIIPARNEEAIIDRLEKLRNNPDLRKEMGEHARERAVEYSWGAYRKKASKIVLDTLK